MFTGDLSDFSLREILRFLATTSSSGVLELRNAETHAGIAFLGGGVCLALLDIGGVHGLAARMVNVGAIDVGRLRQLGAERSGDAVDMAALLARETADQESAAEVYREHTVETLGWLIRRDETRFLFESSDQLDGWPFDVLDLDEAFEVVDERVAEWSQLSAVAGELTRVCSVVPDGAGLDEITLSTAQWRVLSLIDGQRPLMDIIELSGIGHLQTCRVLHELASQGLVEMVEAGATSTLDDLLGGLDALHDGGYADAATAAKRPSATVEPRAIRDRDRGADVGAHHSDGAAARVDDEAVRSAPTPPAELDDAGSGSADPDDVDAEHTAVGDANRVLFERLVGGGGSA
ncbi:MAG: DUF4388 domain-containing protein [Actinobacteria bacterium]|nr:DUF4388 domain-containing protein [Actinomycetota bacterium]